MGSCFLAHNLAKRLIVLMVGPSIWNASFDDFYDVCMMYFCILYYSSLVKIEIILSYLIRRRSLRDPESPLNF